VLVFTRIFASVSKIPYNIKHFILMCDKDEVEHYAMRTLWGIEGTVPLLSTSALDGDKWSALLSRKEPQVPL
jgi:hypothetical protein